MLITASGVLTAIVRTMASAPTDSKSLPPVGADGGIDHRDVCPELRVAYETCYSGWYSSFMKGNFSAPPCDVHWRDYQDCKLLTLRRVQQMMTVAEAEQPAK